MATVSKKEIVKNIADKTQVKQLVVKNIVQNFLNEIVNELGKGNRLEFRGFGIFEVKERSPRTAQNPKTLEKVQVGAKRTVKFRMGKLMKQKIGVVKE
jgi:integration host factor subunit beta